MVRFRSGGASRIEEKKELREASDQNPTPPAPKMALNERLNRFKLQQERCQTSLSTTAASQTSATKSQFAKPSAPAKLPVRFSDDTERLQRMNSVSKSPVGAQIKLVTDLLYKTREAFTAEQINKATYVAIQGNSAVFESLRNNPKVHFDGKRFSYKPTHDLKGKDDLLALITSFLDGLPVAEVEDAYPSVLEDLQALKSSGDMYWLSGQQNIVYTNNPRSRMMVVDDLKKLFHEIKLPQDMVDIEEELQRNGYKPATDTAKQRAAAHIHGQPPKPNKARNKQRRITKLTNAHLPELFNLPLDSKDLI